MVTTSLQPVPVGTPAESSLPPFVGSDYRRGGGKRRRRGREEEDAIQRSHLISEFGGRPGYGAFAGAATGCLF